MYEVCRALVHRVLKSSVWVLPSREIFYDFVVVAGRSLLYAALACRALCLGFVILHLDRALCGTQPVPRKVDHHLLKANRLG